MVNPREPQNVREAVLDHPLKGTYAGQTVPLDADEHGQLRTTGRTFKVLGFESLTIAAAAIKLVAGVDGAKSFVGFLETAQVRTRADNIDPTSTVGVPFEAGSKIVLSADEILTTKFIRTGGTSGTLQGEYYDEEASVFL